MRRLEEEAKKQFSGKLDEKNILFADSKAELFTKKIAEIKDAESELRRLNQEGALDDFVKAAYANINSLFGSGDSTDFNKMS